MAQCPRPDDTPVARQDNHLWTLGDLRHDVTQLVDTLRDEEGERWALCIENGYLFIVALLATLHAGKTPVLPGTAGRHSLTNSGRCSAAS